MLAKPCFTPHACLLVFLGSKVHSAVWGAIVTKDLATTAMLMSEGEMIEGRLEDSGDITFDDYLKVL